MFHLFENIFCINDILCLQTRYKSAPNISSVQHKPHGICCQTVRNIPNPLFTFEATVCAGL